jgi:ubiquinone/menaquinone biosynthesis C-methylase UbiE
MRYIFFLLLVWQYQAIAQSPYTNRAGDPNGSGKWYMGREIALVMSDDGISWLERSEREQEERSSVLLKNLRLKPNMVIADIGAGSGYYSTRLAKMLPQGKVFAVDVSKEMIRYINERVKKEGQKNITSVLGTEQSVKLEANTIDAMLLVDVYHEFSYPKEMAASMLNALKPGGRIYLVEYRAEDPNVPIKAVHKMSQAQAVKEMTAAGFKFEENLGGLPWQHCLVFRK